MPKITIPPDVRDALTRRMEDQRHEQARRRRAELEAEHERRRKRDRLRPFATIIFHWAAALAESGLVPERGINIRARSGGGPSAHGIVVARGRVRLYHKSPYGGGSHGMSRLRCAIDGVVIQDIAAAIGSGEIWERVLRGLGRRPILRFATAAALAKSAARAEGGIRKGIPIAANTARLSWTRAVAATAPRRRNRSPRVVGDAWAPRNCTPRRVRVGRGGCRAHRPTRQIQAQRAVGGHSKVDSRLKKMWYAGRRARSQELSCAGPASGNLTAKRTDSASYTPST